jgi:outer membrane protein
MHDLKRPLSVICALVLAVPAGLFAEDAPAPPQPSPVAKKPSSLMGRFTNPYQSPDVAPPNLANSGRIEALLRGGNLYLSLQDAIALGLENNLDIAIQRYAPIIADTAIMAAEAGNTARTIATAVTPGPNSATVNAVGAAVQATAVPTGAGGAGNTGPTLPTLDPVIIGTLSWSHLTSPQSSAFITGTNFLVQRQDIRNFSVQKGFLTGTTVSLGMNNNSVSSNNPRNDFNPSNSGSLALTMTQRLLEGFGLGVNSRQIRVAKNNREISDLTFKLQVQTTVGAIMNLYWDLVAFNENVRVTREAVASATKLFEDNKRQVEAGTLAPIEVTRAEAQVALSEQQLTLAQTRVLQQETILKTALSRTGVSSPSVQSAHIIPTDQIRIPDVEPISPIQDMVALAISSRAELAQTRIQMRNQELNMKGSKNALLPSVDLFVNLQNNGLAGAVSELTPPAGTVHSNNPFFIGGYGTVLSQLFSRNFPNYGMGFNLNIPLRNRTAQAQVIIDELTFRQQQLGLQRQENQVRVDVQNALIALTQARAQYQNATKQRMLQAQTLDAEQKKLELGASTIYLVIQDQQALTLAESNEVAAKAAYAKARVDLERSTGQILTDHDISVDEAVRGVVSRPPSPIPPASPAGGPPQRQ